MTIKSSPSGATSPLNVIFENREHRSVDSYERELIRRRATEVGLRQTLAGRSSLSQKEELLQQQAVFSQESDHRLLNSLQMIISLLSMQSRASRMPRLLRNWLPRPIASLRSGASTGVCTPSTAWKPSRSNPTLRIFARDFSAMLSLERPQRAIAVEGSEITLPAITAIPLGFIASELITNAAKYGTGRIIVSLGTHLETDYALSVANDGPGLPEGFDPAAGKGLGMRIIRSLVKQIGGELRIAQGDKDQGARFTVLFS